MTSDKKTVLRRLSNCQLRHRRRGKSITYFLAYTVNGERRQEILRTVKASDRKAQKEAIAECESVARKRDEELQTGILGAEYLFAKNKSFVEFFTAVANSKNDLNRKPYRNALLKFKAFLKATGKDDLLFGELSKAVCIEFRDYLARLADNGELSYSTSSKYLEKYRHVINEALRRDYLTKNPASVLPPIPKDTIERDFLTAQELGKLFSTPLPGTRLYDPEVFAGLFKFICFTGIRPGDCKRLTWSDIQGNDEQGYFIEFVPSKTRSKVSAKLVIPLHHEAVDVLKTLRAKQVTVETGEFLERTVPDESSRIFVGLPTNEATVNNFLRAWVGASGIGKEITLYNARHTFASNLILYGVGLFEVSRLLGHSSIKHTAIYSHLTERAKRQAVDALPALPVPNDSQK
jgi:integrase/recombinase XerD